MRNVFGFAAQIGSAFKEIGAKACNFPLRSHCSKWSVQAYLRKAMIFPGCFEFLRSLHLFLGIPQTSKFSAQFRLSPKERILFSFSSAPVPLIRAELCSSERTGAGRRN